MNSSTHDGSVAYQNDMKIDPCANCSKTIDETKSHYHCANCNLFFHGDGDAKSCLDKFNTCLESKTRVVNQTGLGHLFLERFGIKDMEKYNAKDYWKGLNFMQNTVKSKIGVGFPIEVNFFAPVDLKNP